MTDRRDHLQDIAQQHVQRGGLKTLSFRTLADEAGIKSSSVHYHFPEKADLCEALIERYSANLMDQLEEISARTKWNLRKKLNAFVGIFESVAKGDAVCLCGMLAAEYDNLSDQNRQQLHTFFRDMEKWLSAVFNHHKDELATTLPTQQLAKSIVSGLEGALLVDRVAGNNQAVTAQKNTILSFLL